MGALISGKPRKTEAVSDLPARPARGGNPPCLSATISPLWYAERAIMLERICTSIEGRRERGQSLRQAVTWPAWYWKGRRYRTAPQVRVRLSCARLKTLYYRWVNHDRKPEAFALHYEPRCLQVSGAMLRQFLEACAAPGVCCMMAAWRQIGPAGISYGLLTRALPRETRQAIRQAHGERRRILAAERRLTRRILRLPTGKPT